MCLNPVLLVNSTALKLWSQADFFDLDGNICDNITLSQLKAICGYYDHTGRRTSDAEKIDYISTHYFLHVNSLRVPCFISAPCRKCSDCLTSRRQEYEARALFEASDNPYLYFVTLTYDDNNLPSCGLYSRDFSDFLKRFRENLAKAYAAKFNVDIRQARKICIFRCLYVGEYGKKTYRPHYHGILFFKNPIPARYDYWLSQVYIKSWGKGKIYDFERCRSAGASARYITKYLTKQETCFVPAGKNPCFIQGPHKIGLGASNLAFHLDDILNSKDNTIYLRIQGQILRVMIPKFIREKVFPSFSRRYGNVSDCFYMFDKIRSEMLIRRDTDPFTHCYDPRKFDFAYDEKQWLLQGSKCRASKKLLEQLPDIDKSLRSYSDDELNELYSDSAQVLLNLPTEEEFFEFIGSKISWQNSLQLPTLSYEDKCKRMEKKRFNNENFVRKRMLNENFDLSLQL